MELKLTVDGLEKERDFYFSKLRDIELICQEHESESNPVLSRIINILYATEVSMEFGSSSERATVRWLIRAALVFQEGFAPPEDDDLDEQAHLDHDEY